MVFGLQFAAGECFMIELFSEKVQKSFLEDRVFKRNIPVRWLVSPDKR